MVSKVIDIKSYTYKVLSSNRHWYNLHDFTGPSTTVCEDKEDWCSLTKPDCTLEYVKLNCKNHCGLCKNNDISYKFYFVN